MDGKTAGIDSFSSCTAAYIAAFLVVFIELLIEPYPCVCVCVCVCVSVSVSVSVSVCECVSAGQFAFTWVADRMAMNVALAESVVACCGLRGGKCFALTNRCESPNFNIISEYGR